MCFLVFSFYGKRATPKVYDMIMTVIRSWSRMITVEYNLLYNIQFDSSRQLLFFMNVYVHLPLVPQSCDKTALKTACPERCARTIRWKLARGRADFGKYRIACVSHEDIVSRQEDDGVGGKVCEYYCFFFYTFLPAPRSIGRPYRF